MENWSKNLTMLSQPKALELALIAFLAAQGITIEKSKSFGGIVNYHQTNLNGQKQFTFFEKLLNPNDTNLISFTRAQGEYFVVTDLRMLEGNLAESGDPTYTADWINGVSSRLTKNATLSLMNNGVKTLDSIPATIFTRATENPFSGCYPLPYFNLWNGQERFQFPFVMMETASTDLCVRLELFGLGLVA